MRSSGFGIGFGLYIFACVREHRNRIDLAWKLSPQAFVRPKFR